MSKTALEKLVARFGAVVTAQHAQHGNETASIQPASWVEVATYSNNTTAPLAEKKNFAGLAKYIRWKVKTIVGGTAVTFSIRGMLRNN